MNNFSPHELNEQFRQRCREGERILGKAMSCLQNSPGSYSFVVPDDSMAPDFHAGDIAWYRPGYGDGYHVLQNNEGELVLRKVQVNISGEITVSTPEGVQAEFHHDLPNSGFVSLGRCYYAFRQIPLQNNP